VTLIASLRIPHSHFQLTNPVGTSKPFKKVEWFCFRIPEKADRERAEVTAFDS
jgi:hypothetical protein